MLFTSKEQIPLKAYAEMMRAGILQIVSGSAKDIPTVTDVSYFRCGVDRMVAEGRAGRFRRALQVRVCRAQADSDLHQAHRGIDCRRARGGSRKAERIAELRRAVRVPEGGDKSYFFLILSSGDMTRYYPFRIATR